MNWKKILFYPKNGWIVLGLLAVLAKVLLSQSFIEEYYSRGLFTFLRIGFDTITGWFPFALVYVMVAVVFWIFIKGIISFIKNIAPWRGKLLRAGHSILSFLGGLVFFFFVLWGFNYGRIPVEKSLNIDTQPLSAGQLREELEQSTLELMRLRSLLPGVTDSAISGALVPLDLENRMRQELVKTLTAYGYPVPGNVRARLLYPKGILLRISTAGIYMPFTGEGHVDAGLHHLQIPFVIVHEMSHGYGFGDEGTCNFLAYLACRLSEDPYLNYVGELYYWRYVAAEYRDYKPYSFNLFWEELPAPMLNDLLSIREAIERYPDIFPDFRDAAYNAYLHAQGISDGIKNYDRVIMMVRAWREKKN